MRVKQMTVHMYRVRDGFAAQVRLGYQFGSDLFEKFAAQNLPRPQTWDEAVTATRCILADMGLEVERLDFTTVEQTAAAYV